MLFVACWSCLVTVSGVAAPKGPLQSYITGGHKSRAILYHSDELGLSYVFQTS
jgi:hypothetical protein